MDYAEAGVLKQNIIRTEKWNRRTALCKLYGFRAAIVYHQPQGGFGCPPPACDHRLRVKEWLAQRYGQPMTQDYNKQWINTHSEWLVYKNKDREYTIAVKDPRLLTLMLML